jgi:aspartate aminotransferase-like enzyme
MAKLFIPGPIDVSKETYAAMSQPMIGHRGAEFEALYASTQPGLQELGGTTPVLPLHLLRLGRDGGLVEKPLREKSPQPLLRRVFRQVVQRRQKHGPRSRQGAGRMGRGDPPEAVRAKLEEGGFDLVTLIHNETSTGVMNDLEGIARVVKSFPGVLLVVDSVSSFSAVPIEMDKLGIDVLLAGVQKALALPPGLAVFACSEAALERATSMPNRGYYFDFIEFARTRRRTTRRPPRRYRSSSACSTSSERSPPREFKTATPATRPTTR